MLLRAADISICPGSGLAIPAVDLMTEEQWTAWWHQHFDSVELTKNPTQANLDLYRASTKAFAAAAARSLSSASPAPSQLAEDAAVAMEQSPAEEQSAAAAAPSPPSDARERVTRSSAAGGKRPVEGQAKHARKKSRRS